MGKDSAHLELRSPGGSALPTRGNWTTAFARAAGIQADHVGVFPVRLALKTVLPALVAALLPLAWVPGARSQSAEAGGAAVFYRLNLDLARAMDRSLGEFHENSRRVAAEASMPALVIRQTAAVPQAQFWGAFPDAPVRAARLRLIALGVDAAGIFAEEGVPTPLLRMAAVESGFDPRAQSVKGARGLWQLMPETALRFGLRVDAQRDERTHPVRSTRAAARYLRELFLRYGDWLLALAAYNAGEKKVSAAIERAGTRDFWELAQRGWLPEETRRYVPAVLGVTGAK